MSHSVSVGSYGLDKLKGNVAFIGKELRCHYVFYHSLFIFGNSFQIRLAFIYYFKTSHILLELMLKWTNKKSRFRLASLKESRKSNGFFIILKAATTFFFQSNCILICQIIKPKSGIISYSLFTIKETKQNIKLLKEVFSVILASISRICFKNIPLFVLSCQY